MQYNLKLRSDMAKAARHALEDMDFTEVETLFEDALRKLQVDGIGKEIAALLQRDREQGLDAAGRHRLGELLLEKRNLAGGGKVSDL